MNATEEKIRQLIKDWEAELHTLDATAQDLRAKIHEYDALLPQTQVMPKAKPKAKRVQRFKWDAVKSVLRVSDPISAPDIARKLGHKATKKAVGCIYYHLSHHPEEVERVGTKGNRYSLSRYRLKQARSILAEPAPREQMTVAAMAGAV